MQTVKAWVLVEVGHLVLLHAHVVDELAASLTKALVDHILLESRHGLLHLNVVEHLRVAQYLVWR